ncbi:hypothetical protein EMGBS4_05800 [Acidimicrobiaceae bacterium]|nr:hypothetical protein EMGBS4_05800 [Acidimicrobiaceae bacterium]
MHDLGEIKSQFQLYFNAGFSAGRNIRQKQQCGGAEAPLKRQRGGAEAPPRYVLMNYLR